MTTIPVIFEDQYFVALDKPAGLTVTRAESVKEETLEDYLIQTYPWAKSVERGGIVHRLDKDTSGIILVAKSEESKQSLQALFHDRVVQKTYTTLVHGAVSADAGTIVGAIARNPKNREKFAVLTDGREAETLYQVDRRFKIDPMTFLTERDKITKKEKQYYLTHAADYSLVRCFPKTGRTHQIRVHMQHIGHPLVSDGTYTNRKLYRLDVTWCPRHFLHASEIEFKHPFTDIEIKIGLEIPEDLREALLRIQTKAGSI